MFNHKKSAPLIWAVTLSLIILSNSCVNGPPKEKGDFRKSDLVELIEEDTTFKLDIRYATTNNLVGRPVYTEARAFMQRPAAEALAKVNNSLKPLGYGLLIFDGYRPWRVTKLFWDITPEEDRIFVANPKEGSKHNRGCAVDLSLYEIASGKEVIMPGVYDETSERSYPTYQGGTDEQRQVRDLLRSKMEAQGFTIDEYEWWHFNYQDWKLYGIQDIPFNEIE